MAAIVINIAGSYDDKALSQAQRDLDKLKAGSAAAAGGMAASFKKAGASISTIGASIATAGASMTRGVTLPIVGIGIAAAVAFDKVDEGLDTVASRSGFTGKALDGLQGSFKTVASTATQSFDEVAEVVGGIAGKLNLQGPALETFSTKVLNLARVTGTDAKTAAESLTTAMGALGVSAGDSGPLLDSLLAASQRSGLSLDTLTGQLATAAPAFKTYGIGVEQSVGLLAAFGKTGIPSTRVVAGLSTAFKNLREDGVKDLPKGLADVFTRIQNASNPTKATAIAVETFGSRVGVTMAEAIRSGKISLDDLQKGLKGTKGALDEAVTAVEGPQEQFARLKNQAMLLGAQIAELALPIISMLVPAIQSAIDWFKQLDPGLVETIVKIAAVAAVVGPVILIFGKLVMAIGAVVSAIGFIANPVGLIVVAIAALVAGLIYAYNNFEGFRDFVQAVWQGIQKAVAYVVDWFQAHVWPILEEVFGYIGVALGYLGEVFAASWTAISQVVEKVAAWFAEYVWPTLDKVFQLIGQALPVLWAAYKTYWTFIFNAVKTVVEWFMQYVWPVLSQVFSMIGTALGVLWNAYKQYWTLIFNVVKTVVSWITETGWPFLRDAFNNMRRGAEILWEGIRAAFNQIKSNVETVINTVVGILKGIGNVVSTVIGFFDSIRQGIVDKFNAAVAFVKGIPGKILSALGNVASILWSAGSDLIGGLIEGIKARAGEVLSTIATLITDKIPQWVKDRLGIGSPSKVMMEIGQWIPAGLAKGIEGAADRVKAATRKLTEATTAEARKSAKEALEEARKAAAELARRTAETIRDSAVTGLDRVKEKAREVLDYVRSVRDDIRAFGGVMGTAFDKGTLTSGTIIEQMRDRLRVAQNFAGALTTLRSLGLNNTSLQEILRAGPGQGLEIAQALASGGSSAVGEVNSLEALLARTGSYLGDVGAQSQFGTTSGRAQGIVDTQVNVANGAIVINFGAGVDGRDRLTIQQEIERAVREGLQELAREIRAS